MPEASSEKALKQMNVAEFVRRFKREIQECEDSRFVFFIGAGCSISSGIPGANDLVKMWLRNLKKLRTGDENNYEKWAKEEFEDYHEAFPAKHYGKVIEELFLNSETRQREIERLTDGKDPGFGYAVLAKLMGHKDFGSHCNAILTVNFDDLIADALYLYTNKKPLVIVHESLVGFVRSTRKRPLVLKLHGDARLEPKNTESETNELDENVKKVLKSFLAETGLIFIGYGGHDESIAHILNELPRSALPWGIYWINSEIPETNIGKWLRERKAIWVNHLDFDELMLLIWKEFELTHPDERRFIKLIEAYKDTFEKLRDKLESQPQDETTKELSASLNKALKDAEPNWWGNLLDAKKYEKTNPDRAETIYEEAIVKYPNNGTLLLSFISFLEFIKKDYDKAEEYFKKSLELDPKDADILGNYANFLKIIRKDYEKAEEYYVKSLEADPKHANNAGNYAGFLLAKGNHRGFDLLQRAFESIKDRPNMALILEILFYNFAHSQDSDSRRSSLSQLKPLLIKGSRSPDWDLTPNVERAIKDGHPCPEFLSALAKVISNEEDIKSLDRFDAWTKEEGC